MKKIKSYLLALLAGVLIFSGCKKDDPVGPTISFSTTTGSIVGNVTVDLGDSMTVGVIITAGDADLTQVEAKYSYDGAAAVSLEKRTLSGSTANEVFELAARTIAGTEKYTFIVTDKDGLSSEVSFTATVQSSSGPITTYTGKVLGNQNNATIGSFLTASSGTVLNLSSANASPASVDIAYFHGASNAATFAAPDNSDVATIFTSMSSWGTKNQTRFKTTSVTTTQFDAIADDADVVAAFDGNSNSSTDKANMLAANNVIAFKTAAGKQGLIKVTSITGTNSTSGEITFTIKIQQ